MLYKMTVTHERTRRFFQIRGSSKRVSERDGIFSSRSLSPSSTPLFLVSFNLDRLPPDSRHVHLQLSSSSICFRSLRLSLLLRQSYSFTSTRSTCSLGPRRRPAVSSSTFYCSPTLETVPVIAVSLTILPRSSPSLFSFHHHLPPSLARDEQPVSPLSESR